MTHTNRTLLKIWRRLQISMAHIWFSLWELPWPTSIRLFSVPPTHHVDPGIGVGPRNSWERKEKPLEDEDIWHIPTQHLPCDWLHIPYSLRVCKNLLKEVYIAHCQLRHPLDDGPQLGFGMDVCLPHWAPPPPILLHKVRGRSFGLFLHVLHLVLTSSNRCCICKPMVNINEETKLKIGPRLM